LFARGATANCSLTLSARASSAGGMSMPRAFAVFAALRNFEPALRQPRDQDPNPSLALARPVTPGADIGRESDPLGACDREPERQRNALRKPAQGERSMVSRNQATKVAEMIGQGWHTVPRTVLTEVMGGPVLMRKGDKHVMVHPNSELTEPTPEEIAKW
jgi:hypothetical protein